MSESSSIAVDDVQTEYIEMGKGEKADAFDLIEEMQQQRVTRNLKAVEVPKILLPHQMRWNADMSKVRILEKSRRVGASWGNYAAEGALEAAKNNGMSQYYMGYNMSMAAENIGDVKFFAQAYGLVASEISVSKERAVIKDKTRDIITYKVKFASGWVYEALSSNPFNWRSRQGHARIDEAGHVVDLEEIINGALAYKLWGGRISIAGTHNGEDSQFNQYLREVKAGKLPWSHHYIDFDGALKEGFYKRVCLVTGKEWSPKAEAKYRSEAFADYPSEERANEELLCIPRASSGFYFTRLLLEQCAPKKDDPIPILAYRKEDEEVLNDMRLKDAKTWCDDVLKPILDAMPGLRSVLGKDFGRSGDLSYIRVMQDIGGAQWRVAFDLELRNIPFDVQLLILFYIIDRLPLFHHAKFDARGNGQAEAEAALQKYGAQRIECVMFTTKWYAEHFPKYRNAYEGKNIIAPATEDLIADHRRVVLKKGIPGMDKGKDRGSDGKDRHGDGAVAGVLAWGATEVEGQPPAGTSVNDDNIQDTYMPKAKSFGGGMFR